MPLTTANTEKLTPRELQKIAMILDISVEMAQALWLQQETVGQRFIPSQVDPLPVTDKISRSGHGTNAEKEG